MIKKLTEEQKIKRAKRLIKFRKTLIKAMKEAVETVRSIKKV